MCGVVGLLTHGPVAQDIFDALTVLQHRGQDAAGMITSDAAHFFLKKDNGLVRDVFHLRDMERLQGDAGLGHTRYPTAGSASAAQEAQPFFVNAPFGIAMVHNGNLTNVDILKRAVIDRDRRHLNTGSDSEILLNVFAHQLNKVSLLMPDAIFEAARQTMLQLQGAYAAIFLIAGGGLLAIRDPLGIRPLVLGIRKTVSGPEYMVASETVALETLGFEVIGDIAPGEAVYIDFARRLHRRMCCGANVPHPCAFEFVYLARPDSIIDGVSVHQARGNMGTALAQHLQKTWPDQDIDVIIPIPDTGRSAALAMATVLGLPLREGFVKNRYIGRTFIMPTHTNRQQSVRKKLNPISMEFKGKNVLLVDDSIVRGNTCKQIIEMARQAGARKVYFASAAPPVRYPNVYGIDMPAYGDLVAYGKTETEVAQIIGADRLIYQTLPDLISAIGLAGDKPIALETSVFDGQYITGDIDEAYLKRLELERHQSLAKSSVIDLSNAVV